MLLFLVMKQNVIKIVKINFAINLDEVIKKNNNIGWSIPIDLGTP